MSRYKPEELYIANLRGEFPQDALEYMTINEAQAHLVASTGQDFGTDADQWEEWFALHPYKPDVFITDDEKIKRLVRAASRKNHPNE